MAETIRPGINLIILGFVANLLIGGLLMAGFLPAAMMASCVLVASIVFGTKIGTEPHRVCWRLQVLRGWSDEQANDEQVFS